MRLFFREHHGALALCGAMDARVGPARFPAVEIGLGCLDRLETQALQRRLLGVADARFHFAFPIRIADAARQRRDALMGKHVAITIRQTRRSRWPESMFKIVRRAQPWCCWVSGCMPRSMTCSRRSCSRARSSFSTVPRRRNWPEERVSASAKRWDRTCSNSPHLGRSSNGRTAVADSRSRAADT